MLETGLGILLSLLLTASVLLFCATIAKLIVFEVKEYRKREQSESNNR